MAFVIVIGCDLCGVIGHQKEFVRPQIRTAFDESPEYCFDSVTLCAACAKPLKDLANKVGSMNRENYGADLAQKVDSALGIKGR